MVTMPLSMLSSYTSVYSCFSFLHWYAITLALTLIVVHHNPFIMHQMIIHQMMLERLKTQK